MFTGIVEIIGTISAHQQNDTTDAGGHGVSLTIANCADLLADAKLGDSISVDGTCLTITSLLPADASPPPSSSSSFLVSISPETLRRTTLAHLRPGSRVNLERAATPSTKIGGHFVQGHVDTIATIVRKTADGNAVVYRLRPRDRDVLRYVVEKGYVGLDGASLTVTAVGGSGGGGGGQEGGGWFEVMMIPYTRERVVMGGKEEGGEVNVEVDMVGKYVESSVRGYLDGLGEEEKGGGVLERLVERVVERVMREKGVVGR